LKKRVKIVVVDDDEASFPVEELKESGYTIDWWDQIDSSRLNRLESGAFDIIVLDIQGIVSPHLSDTEDGLGVLRRIKGVNANQVVVAFSGQTYHLDKMPFYKLADDTMAKPVTTIKCKEVLDDLIKNRVGVPQYWATIRDLLVRENVPDKKIARLEHELVSKTRKNEIISADRVKHIVGNVETISTVVGLLHQIAALCRLML
jgi:CheY-like chemotaxis protein